VRLFGHKRPIRDVDGNITGQKESPVCAVTREPLGGAFGADKRRRLIVALAAGDTIQLRPHGTRRSISLRAADVYRYAIQCQANLANLERARARKAKKGEQRERARLDAAERRLREAAKREGKL
jgi:hypothetical protein